MKKLLALADSARLDWLGAVLALAGLVAWWYGVQIDAFDVLVGAVFAAIGRGAGITAKRKEQRQALLDVVTEVAASGKKLEVFRESDSGSFPEADTAPIDVAPLVIVKAEAE